MIDKASPASPVKIDVEQVLDDRNPRLKRLLPGFLLRYLKRIVHQEEINAAIAKHAARMGSDFVHHILKELETKYSVVGEDNIPKEGRCTFIANHPLGGLDGLVFIDEISRFHPEVKFIVNDLLMNVTNLEPVFIPVNKHGKQSMEYARMIDEAYSSEAQILYFPAGLCSRKRKGKIEDILWRKNFLAKSIKHKRDVVPCFFAGRNSNFFYNLANLRTGLGIKGNIEMVYLVDEMFKQRGKPIELTIGKPIPYTTFDKRFSMQEWTAQLREFVYSLPSDCHRTFQPVQ
jgi:putative hemolysin